MFEDMNKQAIAKEKYKQLKSQDPKEYTGDYKSPHYIEVENKAVKQTIVKPEATFSTEYKEDFDKASRDYWQRTLQKGLMKYNAGTFSANYGKDIKTLEEFLDRVFTLIKESISNEIMMSGKSTENLKENFKSLEISLKLLSKSVELITKDISTDELTSYWHGFINTYVSKSLSKHRRDIDDEA